MNIKKYLRQISTQVVLLAVVPIILLASLLIVTLQTNQSLTNASLQERDQLEHDNSELHTEIINIKNAMLTLSGKVNAMAQLHQIMLLTKNKMLAKKVMDARGNINAELDNTLEQVKLFKQTLQNQNLIQAKGNSIDSELELDGLSNVEMQRQEGLKITTKRVRRLVRSNQIVKRQLDQYGKSNDATIELIQADKSNQAINNFVFEGRAKINAILKSLTKMDVTLALIVDDIEHDMQFRADQANTAIQQKMDRAKNLTYFWVFICVAILITISVVFAIKRIAKPFAKFTQTIVDVAENSDLTQRIKITSNDDIGDAAKAFDSMLDKFESLIHQVASTTTQLTSSTHGVSEIATESTQNVATQKKQIDQIVNSMNGMNVTVREVASNTASAAESSSQGKQEVASGRGIVESSSEAIQVLANEIENSTLAIKSLEQESLNIGSVLDVIKGIAEQTNLLALNAAIEAARAGEQGRGFAVVADEVRTLASRTQESTNEIQIMIEKLQTGSKKAVEAMESGSRQANNAIENASGAVTSLDTIYSVVDTINNFNSEIAKSADNQLVATEEISQNTTEIFNLSELTTQGAQKTLEASTQLAGLAVELQDQLAQFKVNS